MTLQDLQRHVLALPAAEREQLAQQILDSLALPPLTDVEQAWLDEAERRIAEISDGTVQPLAENEVIDSLKREMGA